MFNLLIKIPAIIADTLIAYIIFITAKCNLKNITAFALSILYALNPAVILDSVIWGQVDSVFVLFVLLSICFLTKRRLKTASVIFVVAILIKPQSLIFSPLFIYAFIKQKNIKEFVLSALLAIMIFALLIIPFSVNQSSPFWIIGLYKSTLSSYPYASVNAFNLFALLGGNYTADTSTFLFFSYKTISLIFIVIIVIFSGWLYFKNRDNNENVEVLKYYLIADFIIIAVFTITSKMHERYLYPAIALSIMSYIYMKSKKILFIFIGVSSTFFINVYCIYVANLKNILTSQNTWTIVIFLILTAICNLFILGYIMNTSISIFTKGNSKPIKHLSNSEKSNKVFLNL